MTILVNYDWPGNVRELANVIERLVVLIESDHIHAHMVQEVLHMKASTPSPQKGPLLEARDRFERAYIFDMLEANDWKIQETADALGIVRSHLWKKMNAYGISKPS